MSHVHMNSRGVIWITIIIINVHNIYHWQIADKNSANIFAYLPYTHSNSDSAVFFFALSVFSQKEQPTAFVKLSSFV